MARYQVTMPYDITSAGNTMILFNSNATVLAYREYFDQALKIIYNGNYRTTLDPSNRMNIQCVVCQKAMNSTQATDAHNSSARHLKMVDSDRRYAPPAGGHRSTAPPTLASRARTSYGDASSLRALLKSAKTDLIGLHMLEEFTSPNHGRRYCKCNLCGSHGRPEAIVNHVIGNTHTDAYLKCRLANVTLVTPVTRANLRAQVAQKDHSSVDDIFTWHSRDYYPVKWEDESGRDEMLESKYKYHRNGRVSPIPVRKNKVKRNLSPKREPAPAVTDEPSHDQSSHSKNVKVMTSKRGVLIVKDETTETEEKGQQVYSYDTAERLLYQLAFIVATEDSSGSGITCEEDAKEVKRLMFLVCNLLYEVLIKRQQSTGDSDDLRATVEIAKKMNGLLLYKLVRQAEATKLHGDWLAC